MGQAAVNQAQARRDLWHALKELDFLSAFFSWFFMLLTRLSEPLMLLSTLYVIAEAGVPTIAVPALHNLSVGIMICSPELILPGSFVVASKAQEQGEHRAGLLLTVCWLFVVLTLVTLISLFVWHLSGDALQWLMCARCAAAVGYSILMRVMSHGQDQRQMVAATDIEATIAQYTDHLQRIEAATDQDDRLTDALQPILAALQEHTHTLEALAALPARMVDIERSVSLVIAEAAQHKPRLSVVERSHRQSVKAAVRSETTDKGAFVRRCLTDDPDLKVADIQRLATAQGIKIAHSYISELRKAFLEEQSA